MYSKRTQRTVTAVAAVLMVTAPASLVHATGTGSPMPWESMMDNMLRFFTGPFAQAAGVIAIVLLGIGLAFTEGGSGMRRLVSCFFGLAIAFSAATWGLDFFGFDGGAAMPQPPAEVVTADSSVDDALNNE